MADTDAFRAEDPATEGQDHHPQLPSRHFVMLFNELEQSSVESEAYHAAIKTSTIEQVWANWPNPPDPDQRQDHTSVVYHYAGEVD